MNKMGHTKAQLKIDKIKIEEEKGTMGLAIEFNQPIQLKEKEDAHECWFLPLDYFETFFKAVRFDQV
jgi:hypothetical protein